MNQSIIGFGNTFLSKPLTTVSLFLAIVLMLGSAGVRANNERNVPVQHLAYGLIYKHDDWQNGPDGPIFYGETPEGIRVSTTIPPGQERNFLAALVSQYREVLNDLDENGQPISMDQIRQYRTKMEADLNYLGSIDRFKNMLTDEYKSEVFDMPSREKLAEAYRKEKDPEKKDFLERAVFFDQANCIGSCGLTPEETRKLLSKNYGKLDDFKVFNSLLNLSDAEFAKAFAGLNFSYVNPCGQLEEFSSLAQQIHPLAQRTAQWRSSEQTLEETQIDARKSLNSWSKKDLNLHERLISLGIDYGQICPNGSTAAQMLAQSLLLLTKNVDYSDEVRKLAKASFDKLLKKFPSADPAIHPMNMQPENKSSGLVGDSLDSLANSFCPLNRLLPELEYKIKSDLRVVSLKDDQHFLAGGKDSLDNCKLMINYQLKDREFIRIHDPNNPKKWITRKNYLILVVGTLTSPPSSAYPGGRTWPIEDSRLPGRRKRILIRESVQ